MSVMKKKAFKHTKNQDLDKHLALEAEPSEWLGWQRHLLAVWQVSELSQNRKYTIQCFQVSLKYNRRKFDFPINPTKTTAMQL